ncbi:hypothetical protein [Cyanobium sp. CH-040]|uniref:hypothetical protein n=1 Tax=Cyanobium sp. CH-040 TaxID=2823708 RepID=UPI0020CD1F8A|nr:hypothetical protein [Cyanobium sp. CH-040]MCP9927138.1 hypothetical protein [Cyanobium sp. CH-040]
MTATLPAKTPLPVGRSAASADVDPKDELRNRITRLDQEARLAADAGAIETSARVILQILDCERRLAAIGPQVLQVIKPRS